MYYYQINAIEDLQDLFNGKDPIGDFLNSPSVRLLGKPYCKTDIYKGSSKLVFTIESTEPLSEGPLNQLREYSYKQLSEEDIKELILNTLLTGSCKNQAI